MKATLEFSLPDDRDDLNLALGAYKIASVICNLDHHLRDQLKHGHNYSSVDEALEGVRAALREVMPLALGEE